MKSKFLTLALLVITFASCTKSGVNSSSSDAGTIISQSSVPAEVLSSFNSSFSGATEVEWRHHSNDDFSSEFNHNSQRHSARFDDKGHKSKDGIISLTAVPQVVLDAFKTQFPSEVVYEWKLRNDGTWKAHYNKAGVKWEATFSAAGALLKNEKA